MSNSLDTGIIYGLSQSHLIALDDGRLISKAMVAPFSDLKKAALDAGFDLQIASSFRDFDRQLAIWNGKFSGNRPILDENNQVVDIAEMDDWQICQAIMLYSALPGASRHHWGCDFDYFDGAAMPEGYRLQLIEDEYCNDGPCSGLYQWLKENAANFGFFFPYAEFKGGIAVEPWHLSYRPISRDYLAQLTPDGLIKLFARYDEEALLGKNALVANMEEIFKRFIMNISEV